MYNLHRERVKLKRPLIEPNPRVIRTDIGCLSNDPEREIPGSPEQKKGCHHHETPDDEKKEVDTGDRRHKLTRELMNKPLVGQTFPYMKKLVFGKDFGLLSIIEGYDLPISKETWSVQTHNPYRFSIRRSCSDGKTGERDPGEVQRRKAPIYGLHVWHSPFS